MSTHNPSYPQGRLVKPRELDVENMPLNWDILTHIFRYAASKQALLDMAKTCRTLEKHAAPFIVEDVSLNLSYAPRIMSFCQYMANKPHCTQYVHRFRLFGHPPSLYYILGRPTMVELAKSLAETLRHFQHLRYLQIEHSETFLGCGVLLRETVQSFKTLQKVVFQDMGPDAAKVFMNIRSPITSATISIASTTNTPNEDIFDPIYLLKHISPHLTQLNSSGAQ